MNETSAQIDANGLSVLRYAARIVQEKNIDIGYACFVGDKAIRVFPNNRVEIADIEYLDREDVGTGEVLVHYIERPSWVTQYPADLSIENIKASLDYAYMVAGLPSLFYITNIPLTSFESREDERRANLNAFKILYPNGQPWITELNYALELFARDLNQFGALSETH